MKNLLYPLDTFIQLAHVLSNPLATYVDHEDGALLTGKACFKAIERVLQCAMIPVSQN